MNIVKERIWRPIQLALFDKQSTTKLVNKEINEIYDIVNKHISEKFGIYIPFLLSIESYFKDKL